MVARPAGTVSKRKRPESSVVVETPLIVTVACGTPAPDGSITLPVRRTCAKRRMEARFMKM
jgi:hypothetical protein